VRRRQSMGRQWRLKPLLLLTFMRRLSCRRIPCCRCAPLSNGESNISRADVRLRCRRPQAGCVSSHLQNLGVDILSSTTGRQFRGRAQTDRVPCLRGLHGHVGCSIVAARGVDRNALHRRHCGNFPRGLHPDCARVVAGSRGR
jgi:hypothetical protein